MKTETASCIAQTSICYLINVFSELLSILQFCQPSKKLPYKKILHLSSGVYVLESLLIPPPAFDFLIIELLVRDLKVWLL